MAMVNEAWELLGRSAPMRSIVASLERLLPSLGPGRRVPTILLQGETGTGKGLLARTIHQAGPRAAGPFVDLNCAAIPATLLEAELFGFERGAFTDARQARTGLIEAAHTGTLFLDEIGLLPDALQAKLLTVLESREVRPLGATRTRSVDVLIVAATNSDLREAVRERRFREDLYHRLAVLVFSLPPLRERGEDVLELAEAFLARACADHAVSPKKLGSDARSAILGYAWPGNVRELANLMDRITLLTERAVIAATDLELPVAPVATDPGQNPPLKTSVDSFTRARVEEALNAAHGNVSAAADRLGVPRSTLRYQLERLGLAPDGDGRSKRRRPIPLRSLAERILAPAGMIEGERKQVTVLFADFQGSMDRLAGGDPEATRKLFDPILGRMIETVRRRGGTVNQVRNDGLMALFGAPLAQEDHAVRACYAALSLHEAVGHDADDLRRTLGADVQIRVGLHSGDVVLRAIDGEVRLDYGAVPQTTHVAAQMEQEARPGTSLMTAETLRLAEGFVEVVPAGPADVYELRAPGAVRSRLAAAVRRGLTQFVGRDAETVQIRGAMDRVHDGRGQVVALVGEPGVGKSRLTWEVARSARAQGWLVLETGSVSASKAPPYLPLADLLRGYFEIEQRGEPERIREKVGEMLLALDTGLHSLSAPLLAILDVSVDDADWQQLDAQDRRRRMLDGARQLILAASRRTPVMVVVDDLQWIDSETQAFLDLLVESLPGARVLLLVNYRPEGEHAWSSKTYYMQVRVDALPAESAGKLLEVLLGDDSGLTPLKQLLVKRGNPFFLEETVRTLAETKALAGERGQYRLTQPIQTIQVAPTVQAMLGARIDRLSPEDKRLLQVASVVGKAVPFPLLQAIADLPDEALRRGLDHLQAAEFVYETGLFPELEYSFKHALTHEVTYGGLLHEDRRALHARIAEAIERLHADRLDEHVDKLAYHALRGEVWDRAVDFLRRAAEAVTRIAYADAAAYYEQALAALRRLPEDRERREQAIDLHFELARCLYSTGHFDRAMAAYRDAERLAVALGDEHRVARVCTGLAYLLGSEADHHGSIEAGERALVLAARVADPALQIWTSVGMAREYFAVGDYQRGVERTRATLDALELTTTGSQFRNLSPPVGCRTWLALCLASIGQFAESVTWAEAATELAERAEGPLSQVWANYTLGRIHCIRGHFARALAFLERAASLLDRGRFPIYAPRVLASLGTVYTVTGRAKDGLALLERAATEGEANRILYEHAMVLIQLGEAHLEGSLEEAERRATGAFELARQHGERGNEAWAVHLQSLVAAAHPSAHDDAALTHATRAMTLAEELGMHPLVAHCHLGLGKLYRRIGKRDEAGHHVTTATTMYRAMDMPFWLEQAEAEMASQ
jgi:transcriptional regulator with AAA-type ATPase domain/class 3 adenylate cyclase/tetratricopeptide (TPR) repeat protein